MPKDNDKQGPSLPDAKLAVSSYVWVLQILGLAAAYFLTGKLGTFLAIPPGYATAIWPPSGIALAGILLYGYRVWPGIFVGSFLVNLATSLAAVSVSEALSSVLVTLAISGGASLQAIVGAYLLRRYANFPNPLTGEKEVFSFLLFGGLFSSLVNSTISVSILVATARIPVANFLSNWGTWYLGDMLGIFIFTPLVLVWLTQPAESWRNRRLAITLPIIAMFVLTTTVVFYESQNQSRRLKQEFNQQAARMNSAVEASFLTHMNVLRSLGSFYAASTTVDRKEFKVFISHTLETMPGIKALSWNPHILSSEREVFETSLKQQGFQKNRITEQNSAKQQVQAAQRAEYVPVSFIEPYQGNEAALGYDVYSDSLRHEAIDNARDSADIATTARITLVQEQSTQYGVLAFLPIYRNSLPHQTLEQRQSNISGYIVGVFRGGGIVTAALNTLDRKGLSYRLIDESAPATEQLLFSSETSELKPFVLQEKGLFGFDIAVASRLVIPIGGRTWWFEVIPKQEFFAAHRSNTSWLILLSGLLLTSMVAVFTLVSSGRGSVLRRLVEQRTAALSQSEERFRSTFEAAPVGVATISLDGRLLNVNRGYCDFIGYSRDELLAMTYKQLTHPDYHQTDADIIKRTLAGEMSSFTLEKQYLHKNGQFIWGNLAVQLIRDAEGSAQHFITVVENIDRRKLAEAQIAISLSLLNATLNSIRDAVLVVDLHNTRVLHNQRFVDLWQIPDEILATTDDSFTLAHVVNQVEDADNFLAKVRQLYATPEASSYDSFSLKNGKIIERYSIPQRIDGKVIGRVWSFCDITERVLAEQALGIESEKNNTLLRNASDGIHILDHDGNLIEASDSFCAMLGYRRDEIIGMNVVSWNAGHSDTETIRLVRQQFAQSARSQFETRHRRKDGSLFDAEVSGSPLELNGKPALFNSSRDISARKTAEDLLRKLSLAVEQSPNSIIITDLEANIEYVNEAFVKVTGFSRDEVIGNNPRLLNSGNTPSATHEEMWTALVSGQIWKGELINKKKNGSEYLESALISPVRQADGTITHYLAIKEDITAHKQTELQLQTSHDLFTNLSRQVPGMVYQFRLFPDGHSSFPYASAGIRDIYEVTPEQVSEDAAPVLAILHPDDYDMIMASIHESAYTLNPWRLEYRVILPKKGVRWLSGLAKPEILEDDSTLWHGFITDITAQVLVRNEARAAKKALESILAAATEVSIIAVDGNGLITMFNRGAERMLGYSSWEVIGKHTPALFHQQEEIEQRSQELTLELGRPVSGFNVFVEIAEQSGSETRIWTYVRKDQSNLKVSLVVTTIRNQNNEIAGYLGIAEDITERKQAENERDLLLKIIEDAPDFIATADMQAHLQYLNTAGSRLIGLPADVDLSTLAIKDVHPEWAANRVLAVGIPAVLSQGYWQGETALLHRDGMEIPVSQLLLLHRDSTGKPEMLSMIMRDITSSKQVEQVLLEAKESAEAHANSKAEFLANMSHEIRTPMNAIIGLSQLALNKELSFDIRNYLEKIYSSSTSLLGIINDILDFSKLESGRLRIEHELFDLDILVDKLSLLFTDQAAEKHLVFKLGIAADVPRNLVGDSLRLQQVLTNLLGNAIKFTEQGSVSLKISVAQIDQSQVRLLFCIADTGIGMSATDLNILFQPFSQVDGSITRRFGGTGLGLAISQTLLQLMGGEFSVTSNLGKGSCFSFELVLGVSPISLQRYSSLPRAELAAASQLLVGKRILVAEDNLINQQVVCEFLKLSGVIVQIANNGEEALEWLKLREFDAVLMDVHMPIMDGFAATKHIRSQAQFADLPVLALTAGVTQEEQEKCLASGMNDFIGKPINPDKLTATLLHWLRLVEQTATIAETKSPKIAGISELPGFDLHNLLLMLGNNQEHPIQLLLTFSDSAKTLIDDLETLVQSGDRRSAKDLVHKFKGSSGCIGALQLYAALEALESELNGELSAVSLGALKQTFNQVMSVIASLQQAEQPIVPGRINVEALKLCATELEGLLNGNDFISEDLLNTLKVQLTAPQLALFALLHKQVNTFHYHEARKTLSQLTELARSQERP